MTQANSPLSSPPAQDSHPGSSAGGGNGNSTEHLAHLYKMSTTAGLGSTEYVAVNILSVVAVLFGVASLLSLLGNALLVIPLVGVVLGFVAIRQITSSNGTQTGLLLAGGGLLLSLLIGGGVVGFQVMQMIQTRNDQQAISDLIVRFGNLLNTHQYEQAYAQFDDEFKLRVKPDAFKIHLMFLQERPDLKPIDSAKWNGLADFQNLSGDITAMAGMKLHIKDGVEQRTKVRLRKVGDVWFFDQMDDLFPSPTTPGDNSNQGGQGMPGGQ